MLNKHIKSKTNCIFVFHTSFGLKLATQGYPSVSIIDLYLLHVAKNTCLIALKCLSLKFRIRHFGCEEDSQNVLNEGIVRNFEFSPKLYRGDKLLDVHQFVTCITTIMFELRASVCG